MKNVPTFVEARGQLRHRFWGSYSAVIVLGFGTTEQARLALPMLPGWKLWKLASEPGSKVVSWSGGSDALKVEEERLAAHGADRSKIASLRFSVDYMQRLISDWQAEGAKVVIR